MDFKQKVKVGRTNLSVTRLGLGTAAIGFMCERSGPCGTLDRFKGRKAVS